MKRKSKELLQYKNFYLHDELDLCCEDLTKEELTTSQCLSNEENFIAVVTLAWSTKPWWFFFKLSFKDNYIPQYSAMTFLASSLALICNLITKRPIKRTKKDYLISKKYQ